jgi:Ca-activated chloride channel family protein
MEHSGRGSVEWRVKTKLWILLGWLALAQNLSAAGLIIIHEQDFWRLPPPPFRPPEPIPPVPPYPHPPPRPPVWAPPVWAPLEMNYTKADVRIRDQIATTVVEQEFYNPNARQLEGTFLFPIPKGAQVNKFTMEINGKPVEGELLAADKAKGIYEDIVRRLRDPALLEYAGRDLFKVRIFPIEPNARKRITLSYSQLLRADSGLVNFAFPLSTEKFSAKPIRSVSLKVDVETKRPLKSIYSPSHKVEIQRHGDTRATVGYEASDLKPDADFQLFFAQETDPVGVNLLTYKTAGEDGYFLLLASPGQVSKDTRVLPKDVAFVLDTSGSMAGAKLEQAKKALLFCVENLNAEDRFEILRFATEVEPLFDQLSNATDEPRRRARSFIQGLKPIGGTAIHEALRRALALRPEQGDRPFVVIFLTDGLPTVGPTSEEAILGMVGSSARGNVRIFCFGIGTDVNTHLLDKITEDTRAFSQYVLPEEDIEVKVSSFFSKIKDPVLANPKLLFPEAVRVTRVYPAPLPDLFRGEQIVVAGRFSGKGDGAIRLEGTVRGETTRLAYDVKFPEEARDHEFIPRLWATRRVGYLLDEIRLRGESKELKDEVVELARQYGIVTPYTAYLILEDEGRRGVVTRERTVQLENLAQRTELRDNYQEFMQSKDGGKAVASARSYRSLKAAEAASDAIVSGNAEVLRFAPLNAPAPVPSLSLPSAPATESAARQYGQQSRFVAGRAFFQNGTEWVDAGVQKLQNARRVRVQFGSAEYFDLARREPGTAPWLALGRNVQFTHAGTVYEVHE